MRKLQDIYLNKGIVHTNELYPGEKLFFKIFEVFDTCGISGLGMLVKLRQIFGCFYITHLERLIIFEIFWRIFQFGFNNLP
jgi:hypothetical protein